MPAPEDLKLLSRARTLGYLSEAEASLCREILIQSEASGRPVRLAQLIMEKRLMSSGELIFALRGAGTPMPPGATPTPGITPALGGTPHPGAAPSRGGGSAGTAYDPTSSSSGLLGELARAAASTPLKAGDRLGPYELHKEIARGGMGVLFEAVRPDQRRRVAVKVLSARASSSPKLIQRFQQEAALAASLEHPNVIKIHEVGHDRGHHFIVMDFFDGRSLADLLRVGALAPKRAVQVVATVAHAVQFMHDRRVLHRDLKPGNILVGHKGQVCVTDFGLAKDFARTDVQLTQLGVVVGTPAYMAPEQARGDLSSVGPWSDVYSLGATLYRALSGVYPHDSDSFMTTIEAITTRDPPPLAKFRPDCPPELVAVIERAMARGPADRPTAGELGALLERVLATNPILMPPAPANSKV